MDPNTLKIALDDKALSVEMAKEARVIGIEAREDRRVLVGRMDELVRLDVAKAVGATIKPAPQR